MQFCFRLIGLQLLTIVLLLPSVAIAQFTPGVNNNVTLKGNLNNYSRYSNIWGYVDPQGNEYAIIGHNQGTSVVNITDPDNPVEVAMIPGPSGNQTIWREIKTYSHYAYVVTEHTNLSSLTGIQIIDLSGLPNTATYVKRILWPGVSSSNARAHTIFIDSAGYLYINGGTATQGFGDNEGGIRIFSLADPLNPAPVGIYATKYVHDIHVQDSILFAHNIYEFPGVIDVINVKNRANPQLIHTHIYPNGFAHSSWITPDKNYLISTDEMQSMTVKFWDVSALFDNDPNNNTQINMVSQYLSASGTIAHEPRIRGDYLFLSHYVEGLRVLDISNPADPVEVGYYDTHPGGGNFSGQWGVYPFFPSGNIVVSDINTGLYVFSFNNVKAGGLNGTVTDQFTGSPISAAQVKFVEAGKTVSTGSDGSYSYRTNEGNHTIVVTRFGYYPDTIQVNIPQGSSISLNVRLGSSSARMNLSKESFTFSMPVNSQSNDAFVVSHSGTSGILNYTITTTDDTSGFSFSGNHNNSRSELQWLTLSRTAGSLNSGAADTVGITVNTTGLANNTQYTGFIVLHSNDPFKDYVYLPVTLNVGTVTSSKDPVQVPLSNELKQNYPNPFNPSTRINFSVKNPGHVSLKIYNVLGNEVAVLANGYYNAGSHSVQFNGSNLPSGVYFYTIKTDGFSATKKLTLIK